MRRSLIWSLAFMIVVAIGSLAGTILSGHSPLLGLDLKGGVSVVLQPTGTATNSELQTAVAIIDRRVNGLGVSNSNVTRQGNDVVIELPGIKDSQKALDQLGQTAVLYFRPVYCEIPAYAPATRTTPTTKPTTPTTRPQHRASTATTKAAADVAPRSSEAQLTSAVVSAGSATTTPAAASTATTAPAATTPTTSKPAASTSGVSQADCSDSNAAQLPTTPIAQGTAKNAIIAPVNPSAFGSNFRYVLGPADMTGSIVSGAAAEVDTSTGQYSVQLTLTNKGSSEFDNIAAQRYACYRQNTSNPPMCALEAFELDGQVESAPYFSSSSFNGSVSITGNFTSSQASDLANVLKYGSLPVRFVPQSVQTVSASIGSDSLRAGILAGVGGLAVVLIYMLIYYRALGLVVVVGLAVGGAILYSLISLLGTTSNLSLTLSGVTGIIVSIGITVDSYVVYFERLKDEVRTGRSVRQSTERSFSRAFRTVLTADLVSFMAALILYLLTVGDVRGFAFMLGLSTLLDVVTAFLFIRPAVILVGRRRSIVENRVFGISRGLGARAAAAQN